MIRNLDHVGIAVRSLQGSLSFWAEALGLGVDGFEDVEGEGVRVAFMPVGGARIELLEPTRPDSPVAQFLEKRGGGLHHITLEVTDLDARLGALRAAGIRVLDDRPRPGSGGSRVAFVHPHSTGGVLLELVERRVEASERPSLRAGQPVLVYLRDPQEKLWGLLRRLDTAGLVVEAIDLTSFDDWVAQVERAEESVVGPSILFLPMLRVERVLLDRAIGRIPSLADRFRHRTGRTVQEVLGDQEEG